MKLPITIVAGLFLSLPTAPAHAYHRCVGHETRTLMGQDLTEYLGVTVNQPCVYDINPHGTLFGSELSQPPQHGTVKKLDIDTWLYEPAPGYRGSDSFSITARGQSFDEAPGTSVLSFTVEVQ